MVRRCLAAVLSAGTLLFVTLTVAGPPAFAAPTEGKSFAWVGAADGSGGDGHSWSDARNWKPRGVPGNGDSVGITAAPGLCTVDVDEVPSVRLRELSIVHFASCHLTVSGGSITVLHILDWQGGAIDSHLVFAPSALGEIVGNGETGLTELDKDLVVQGTLDVRGSVEVGPGAQISVASGGNLRVNPGTDMHASTPEGPPGVLQFGTGGIVSVPADPGHETGPATISGLQVDDAGGTTSIGKSSTLRILHGPRGSISDAAVIKGGGTLMLGDPTDASDNTAFQDRSRLALMPGGTINGPTAVFTGDGFMTWRGGRLSGLDLGFVLDGFTVAGPHPKLIDKDSGFFSNIEVLSDATFAAGTDEHHNILSGGGGSFEVFDSTLTVRDNVEIKDAGLTESDFGNFIIDPGDGGTVYGDPGSFITASSELDVVSGTFISAEGLNMGLTDSAMVVEKGAVVRLPNPDHPLTFFGQLTGQGEIDGDVVNAGGTFEPYNAGSSIPLRITGGYSQQPGAQLLLDLSAQSLPVRIGGSASVQGTVTYNDQPGYSPEVNAKRRLVNTTTSLSWTPDCEETTGQGSDVGHWVSSQLPTRATATFSAGAGDSC